MVQNIELTVAQCCISIYNQCMTDNCYRIVQVALKMLQRDNHLHLETSKELKVTESIEFWQDQVVETRLAMDEVLKVWSKSLNTHEQQF